MRPVTDPSAAPPCIGFENSPARNVAGVSFGPAMCIPMYTLLRIENM